MSAVSSSTSSPAGPPSKAGSLAKPKRPRSYTIDFMRVILFSCVVFVHTIGTINQGPDVIRQMDMISLMMHYTRYGFVFVTVFVLFLGYYHKDTKATTFWRRRFGLVVLPYLVWSVLYTFWEPLMLSNDPWPGFGPVLRDAALEIVKGDAKYQLYFLLISMQIYFFFPLLRWVVKKTEGHHGKLFAAGAAIQLAMAFWLQGVPEVSWLSLPQPADGTFLDLLQFHAWKLLPTFMLLVVIGALAAVHFERAHNWMLNHVGLLIPLIVLGTVATFGFYWYRTRPDGGITPGQAVSAADPTLLPWLFASIIGLYLISAKWNERRGDGSGIVAKIVDLGSVRAFGVFAAHPLVIDSLLLAGVGQWLFATFDGFTGAVIVRSLVLAVVTFVCCVALVEVFLRTPLAKAFVARDRQPLRKPKPKPEPEQRTDEVVAEEKAKPVEEKAKPVEEKART